MKTKIITGSVILLCIGVLGVGMGMLTIWSLNTLFGLGIPITPATVLAAIVLSGVVSGAASPSRGSK